MSSDQDKENLSPEERIKDIEREETEDPTAYYAQGDTKESFDEESEFSRPVPSVEKATEEMNLLKAVAYLGFGLAALAIVFILFFVRDLDNRVGGVDLGLSSLEEKMAPLRKEVKDGLEKVNADITDIKAKIDDSESRLAVTELKRALVAIQGMELSNSPEAKAKSSEVIIGIQALLGEFGTGEADTDRTSIQTPAGEIRVEEASDLIELPIVTPAPEEQAPEEQAPEEQAPEEQAPIAEEHIEEPAVEVVSDSAESSPEIEEAVEESVEDAGDADGEGKDDEDDEEDEDDEDDDE